jgi:hypothetical protein
MREDPKYVDSFIFMSMWFAGNDLANLVPAGIASHRLKRTNADVAKLNL